MFNSTIRKLGEVAAAALMVAAGLTPAPAAAEGLFQPMGGRSPMSAQASSQGVVRARAVGLDMGYLGRMGGDMRAESTGRPVTLGLNLFDDVTVTAQLRDAWGVAGPGVVRAMSAGGGARTLIGTLAEDEAGIVALTVSGADVMGSVWTRGRYYSITPGQGGAHVIEEVDPQRLPEHPDCVPPGAPRRAAQAMAPRAVGEPVDLLLLFTRAADQSYRQGKDPSATPEKLAQTWIAFTNQVFKTSAISSDGTPAFRLVGVEVVDYTEKNEAQAMLADMGNPNHPVFGRIHALRDSLGADLVAMIVSEPTDGKQVCGMASGIPGQRESTPNDFHSLVAWQCAVANLSLPHEMAHTMGARHDVGVDSTPGTNHGYVDLGRKWRTVMGYNTVCTQQGTSCTRQPVFSNPAEAYQNWRAGTNDTDNAARLRDNIPVIAAYRGRKDGGNQPPPPPTTQPPITQPPTTQPPPPPPPPQQRGGWEAITE